MKFTVDDYCLHCQKELYHSLSWTSFLFGRKRVLCDECKNKLIYIEGERCKKCSRPLANVDPKYVKNGICIDCLYWERSEKWADVLVKNESIFVYNDFLKELLAKFKYRGDYALAKIFTDDIKKTISDLTFDYIVPIPLSEERLYERGFNQVEALIREAGFSFYQMLTRNHSEKQSKKTRAERLKLAAVFKWNDMSIDLRNRKILLVDDIYTTGTTVRQAALVLKSFGAKQIISLTLCRGI